MLEKNTFCCRWKVSFDGREKSGSNSEEFKGIKEENHLELRAKKTEKIHKERYKLSFTMW